MDERDARVVDRDDDPAGVTARKSRGAPRCNVANTPRSRGFGQIGRGISTIRVIINLYDQEISILK